MDLNEEIACYNEGFDSKEKDSDPKIDVNDNNTKEESVNKKTMTFDDAMIIIGEFGPYQLLIFLMFTLGMIIEVMLVMTYVFVAATPQTYYCLVPGLDNLNLTEELKHNISIVGDQSCLMYDRDYSNWTLETVEDWKKGLYNDSAHETSCKYGWYFSKELYEETIVTQWNLVCEDEWKASFVYSVVGIGQLLGAITWGILIDKFGRRWPYCFAMFAMVLFSGGASFSPYYFIYCILQFFMGINTVAAYSIGATVAVEITGVNVRGHLSTAVNYFWSLGYMVLSVIAYFVRHWSRLQLYISGGSLICLLLLFFIKESPRWLYTKNYKTEANKILKQIAKYNRKKFPEDATIIVPEEEDKQGSVRDLCGNSTICSLTVILFFIWFSNSLVYFGISLYLPTLSTNPYLNFFISGAVEFPGYLIAQLTIAYLGRKWPLCSAMSTAALCLYILIAIRDITSAMDWPRTLLALIGKLCVTASWSIAICFTNELYPTVIRGRGLLFCTLFGNLANILAPQVNLLGNVADSRYPPIIFGSFAIAGALISLLLPETKGKPLRDSMDEMKNNTKLARVKGMCKKNSHNFNIHDTS